LPGVVPMAPVDPALISSRPEDLNFTPSVLIELVALVELAKYMAILDKQWTEKKDLTSDGKPLQVVPTINVYASESKTD